MAATITAPLAPLTTIFTPPCSISWLLTSSKDPSQFPPFPTTGPSSCDPPRWATNIADKGFQFYSPAICPSGFEVGPGCHITKTRTAEGFPAVEPGETAVYCVPSGFTCTTDTTDFRGGVWGATRGPASPPLFTVGPALQIRFRDSDLSLLETHPLTPGLTLAGLPAQRLASASPTPPAQDPVAPTLTPGRFTTIPTPATPPPAPGTPSPSPSPSPSPPPPGTSTSSADPPAHASNMTIPSDPTGTAAAAAAAAAPSGANTAGSRGRASAGIAAILVSALLSVLAVAFAIYACARGRRTRSWALFVGRPKGQMQVGVGVWIGTRGGHDDGDHERGYEPAPRPSRLSRTDMSETPPPSLVSRATRSSAPQVPRPIIPRAFTPSDPEGGIRIPIFAQGQYPRPRLKVPPAELDDSQEGSPSRHGSWVSRVSRMLSRAARSSGTSSSSSRSRSRSGQTARKPASEEWEHFFLQGRGPGGLTAPNLTYTRPSSTASTESFLDDPKGFLDPVRAGSFDRLSEGTFGARGAAGRQEPKD